MDYDYMQEMETIINGYDELQCLLFEYQGNEAEKCYLPVSLLEKMNEQLRDTFTNIRSESFVQNEVLKELYKKVGIDNQDQQKVVVIA
jgi:hypothetical protein